jgi:hypothetical protein
MLPNQHRRQSKNQLNPDFTPQEPTESMSIERRHTALSKPSPRLKSYQYCNLTSPSDRQDHPLSDQRRLSMSYICVPCIRVRGKIIHNTGPTGNIKAENYTCEDDDCEATYNSFSGKGKVNPNSTDWCTRTGLPVIYKDNDRNTEKERWICQNCMGRRRHLKKD